MSWREVIFRIGVAVAWALFGMVFVDAAMHDQAALDSAARRLVWCIAAVISFLVAIGLVVLGFMRGGQIKWLSASTGDWQSWTLLLCGAVVGVGAFLSAQFGYADATPIWVRLEILWLTVLFVVWGLLSLTGALKA